MTSSVGGPLGSQGKRGAPGSQGKGTQSHKARRQEEQQKGGLKAAHTRAQMDARVSLVGPSSPPALSCAPSLSVERGLRRRRVVAVGKDVRGRSH